MSIHVRAVLIGLAISSLCPLSALGAYICASKNSFYVLGLVLFALAYLFSLPGFFVGWFAVNVTDAKGFVLPLIATYLANWIIYTLAVYWVLRGRKMRAVL